MQYQFSRYDVITVLEQHGDNLTYLVSARNQAKQKAILKIFEKPALLGLAKRDMFFQRLEALKKIKHPHIVPIIDGGIEKRSSYVVSEYMAGGSLRARLDKISPERLPFDEALTIVLQIGQALDYLHTQEIVHGHLKPKHIFFDKLDQAFLADIYSPDQLWPQQQEDVLSDIPYLAPEQLQESFTMSVSTALSDQYTLCCIAYELFTGQTPFTSTDLAELKEQQRELKPAPLTSIVADLPETVDEAILKGLAKEPYRRYAELSMLLTTLKEVALTTSQPALAIAASPQPALVAAAAETTVAAIANDTTSVDMPASADAAATPAPTKPMPTTKPRKRSKLWLAPVIMALICSVLAYLVYAPHGPSKSVADSNVSATAIASSPTARVSSSPHATQTVAPTSTAVLAHHPLPTVTATPTIKATSTPAAKSTPKSATPTPTATPAAPIYTGQLKTRVGLFSSSSTNLIPQLSVNNVRIEADVTVGGTSGGVVFRTGNSSAGYRFIVRTSGSYNLTAGSTVLANESSSAIKTGSNVSNHVTIIAVGSQITISINAQSVVNISDSTYSSGSVGVTASGATTTATDNFTIYTN